MRSVLDNVVWNCLSGPHAQFAVGSGGARCYAPGFSPIVGFRNPEKPDLKSLKEICPAGQPFYSDCWSGPVPDGLSLELESTMFKMIWEASIEGDGERCEARHMGPEHATQALELATLTHPGPFGIKTIELGDYFGYFDGPRLVAMAGERMCAGEFREISGVCTHPEFQGRGLARRLIDLLVRRQIARGETPFLHVMADNEPARRLYRRLGFSDYLETVVRVLSRTE